MPTLRTESPTWAVSSDATSAPQRAIPQAAAEAKSVYMDECGVLRLQAGGSFTLASRADQAGDNIPIHAAYVGILGSLNGTSVRRLGLQTTDFAGLATVHPDLYAAANETAEWFVRGWPTLAAEPNADKVRRITITDDGATDVEVAYGVAYGTPA